MRQQLGRYRFALVLVGISGSLAAMALLVSTFTVRAEHRDYVLSNTAGPKATLTILSDDRYRICYKRCEVGRYSYEPPGMGRIVFYGREMAKFADAQAAYYKASSGAESPTATATMTSHQNGRTRIEFGADEPYFW